MSVRTKKGDDGKSSRFNGGSRIPKNHSIFQSLGAIDGVNSYLGFPKLLSRKLELKFKDHSFVEIIDNIQENLFIIQAEIGGAPGYSIAKERVENVSSLISEIESELPPMKTFFKSGGDELSTYFDYCRTLVRGVERQVIDTVGRPIGTGGEFVEIKQTTLAYLNALSDLLFVLARLSNSLVGAKEEAPKYK